MPGGRLLRRSGPRSPGCGRLPGCSRDALSGGCRCSQTGPDAREAPPSSEGPRQEAPPPPEKFRKPGPAPFRKPSARPPRPRSSWSVRPRPLAGGGPGRGQPQPPGGGGAARRGVPQTPGCTLQQHVLGTGRPGIWKKNSRRPASRYRWPLLLRVSETTWGHYGNLVPSEAPITD